jgi:hypothetical protein
MRIAHRFFSGIITVVRMITVLWIPQSVTVSLSRVEEMKKYAAVFEKAPYNWAAYVPDLSGCVTIGSTLEETRRLVAEAIEFHI